MFGKLGRMVLFSSNLEERKGIFGLIFCCLLFLITHFKTRTDNNDSYNPLAETR